MTKSLNIIFAGTPAFAAYALEKLLHSQHKVIAVYTNPDRPKGRGLKLATSPVKELALTNELPLYQPASLKDEKEQQILRDLNADVLVVAAYGMLLPASVLRIPRFGCINIHPSLLPRWRGAAPIQRAIFAGDTITGVSIMQMDTGLDTGPILLQQQYVMEPDETAETLHDKLALLGANALLKTLDQLAQGPLEAIAQDNHLATYAHKISKEEALIDWQEPAAQIEREIRAFTPWPIAYTTWQSDTLRIWQAKSLAETHHAAPRTIVRASQEGIDIATGQGVLRLQKMQLPGGKILSVNDFYNAKQALLKPGEKFT